MYNHSPAHQEDVGQYGVLEGGVRQGVDGGDGAGRDAVQALQDEVPEVLQLYQVTHKPACNCISMIMCYNVTNTNFVFLYHFLYLINPSPGRVKFSQWEKINIDSPARGERKNINVVQTGKIDLSARRRRLIDKTFCREEL